MATLLGLPAAEDHYGFEVKWDGFRGIAYVEDHRVRVLSRRGRDLTGLCPELVDLPRQLGRQAVLDGELVALDDEGRPSFEAMQRRLRPAAVSPALVYMIFDLLSLDGRLTVDLAYQQRRELLGGLAVDGEHWRVTPSYLGQGSALLEATRAQGLEGIVAKRLDGHYRPGARSRSWLKVKNYRRGRFVVGAWVPPEPKRRLPAGLLVGSRQPDGSLRFAARLEFGFRSGQLDEIRQVLPPATESPFSDLGRVPDGVAFAKPVVEVEVQYLERASNGALRHASFKRVA